MNTIDKAQNKLGQLTAKAQLEELEEENLLLIEQIHVVQVELERLHHETPGQIQSQPVSSVTLDWVEDQLPEIMAENLKCHSILEAQKEIHQLEAQHALVSKLGGILIEATNSPASLLTASSRLLGVWRKEKKTTPPGELGGKGFDKIIAAYRDGGLAAVEELLASVSVSSFIQANALTAVARSLMQQSPEKAAEIARRAYAIEPRPFRLKWLAFRLHEAGELFEAEAMLEVLPSDMQFSDSEARQASRLRNEATQARMREAKQKCAYSERRAELGRQVTGLTQERDEQAALAAKRQSEIEVLRQGQVRREKENVELTRARDEQIALAMRLQGEIEALQQIRVRLEQGNVELLRARDEQVVLAVQRQGGIDALQQAQARLEQESVELTRARDEQVALVLQYRDEIEALQQARMRLERENVELTRARDGQAVLAVQRQGGIEALQQAQIRLEQENIELTRSRDEQAALTVQRQGEIEVLRQTQTRLEQEHAELTRARDEQATLAVQRQGGIEALEQARARLEQEHVELTRTRDEQVELAIQRQGEIEVLQQNRTRLEQGNVELIRARDEQVALAVQRQGEIEALKQTSARLEQERSVLAERSEGLQKAAMALTSARDEQAALAAQRQGELLQLTRAQAALEKEKAVLELKQRELEQATWASQEQTRQIVQKVQDLASTLAQRNGVVDDLFKKQSDSLIQVRKYLDGVFKSEIANATKQTQAFIGLQNYYATGELPGLNCERNSWPVSQDFALYLVELIEVNKYDLIIELGSGISTVIVARVLTKALRSQQGRSATRFVSFDHLGQYYEKTRSHLVQAGLEDTVQLMLAPLQDWQAPNGNTYPYYSCQVDLNSMAQKHDEAGRRVLVIVDGPPAATGKHARYPAGPLLLQQFTAAHIDILLDDYIRDDEKEVTRIWQTEMQATGREHNITELKFEKEACLISVSPLKNR